MIRRFFVRSGTNTSSLRPQYGSHVYMLVRRDALRASKVMAKRALSHPKITVLWNTVPVEAKGDGELLTHLRVKDTKSGEERDLEANGLFYAIGHVPATELVKGQLELDEDGYIKTRPGTAETSVEGVFAAGDVQVRKKPRIVSKVRKFTSLTPKQDKIYRQAITSASSGCQAAIGVERWLSEHEPISREDVRPPLGSA